MKIDGSCHCGEITFEADVDPDALHICHCTDCQTLSGSAFRANIPAPAEHFVLLSGTPKTYIKTAESGNKRLHAFCGTCGTPIYSSAVEIHRAMAYVPGRSDNAPSSHRGDRSGGSLHCPGWTRSLPSQPPRRAKQPIRTAYGAVV
jgi:hypothetical protein